MFFTFWRDYPLYFIDNKEKFGKMNCKKISNFL